MAPKDHLFDLGKRERQIVEAVYRLGEASVSDVLAEIADPPSYSSVRAMLGTLVQKDVLAYRHEGKRYLYRPVASKGKTQKSAVRRLVAGLFARPRFRRDGRPARRGRRHSHRRGVGPYQAVDRPDPKGEPLT